MTTKYVAAPAPKLQVKSTRELASSQAHILIYGKTKAGKTSTAVTLEEDPRKNAIICTQPEEQLAHLKGLEIPYVVVRSIGDLDEALKNPLALFPDAHTLIIDDFTEAVEIKKHSVDDVGDKWKPYREAEEWTRKHLVTLLSLPCNLVMTAFERQAKEETSSMPWISPDFPNAVLFEVSTKMDFIMRMEGFKLRVKPQEAQRIMAGNRWPKSKVGSLSEHVEADLGKLWANYQKAIE